MSSVVNEGVRERAQAVASQLLQTIEGAKSVLLATADGFDLASAGAQEEAARVAAMTSSIAAIGQVVSREVKLGVPRCLVVDASEGFLIVRSTHLDREPLVINVLTTRDALLGLAMHAVNAAASRLERN